MGHARETQTWIRRRTALAKWCKPANADHEIRNIKDGEGDDVILDKAMSPAHEAHLQRIKDKLTADLDAKYRAGQEEHGGQIWEKPGMLEHAYAEVLDLAVYIMTLMEQRETRRRITGRDT